MAAVLALSCESLICTDQAQKRYESTSSTYRGADKSLARPGRKQAGKQVRGRARFQQHRDASCYQVFFLFFLQGTGPREIHAILTETVACFLPDRAKDLSAHVYVHNVYKALLVRRQSHVKCLNL